MQKHILFLILLFYKLPCSYGQRSTTAQKYLYKALSYRAAKDTVRAYKYARKAIEASPAHADAFSTLGMWYSDSKKHLEAARVFAQAGELFRINSQNNFAIPAARNYALAQKPDSALYWLSKCPNRNAETEKIAQRARAQTELARAPDTNTVHKLSIRVNSNQAEIFPSWSADGQTLYFTRRINGVNEDFYYAQWDSCGDWFTAKNMGSPPNTSAQESSFTITADNHYLVYMRSDNRSENGWGRGGCDLYLAYRIATDSPWTTGQSFGATINTPAFEGMPSLSPDFNDMYFVSNRPGGYGGMDIWVTHFSAGLWQMPINLGPQINTPEDEISPFIAADGQTLYFGSKGHPGLGGSDLFMTKKINDSTWVTPQNLGKPINSNADEYSVFIAPNGKDALFASDRGKTGGDMDIYQTTLPGSMTPTPTVYIHSRIYDSLYKSPVLLGNISLYDSTGNFSGQYHANKGDGSLLISIAAGQKYRYEARGFNYQITEGYIIADSNTSINFPLLPGNYKKPTSDTLIARIHFEKNITSLTDSQRISLLNQLAYWLTQKGASYTINSYTDNTGTPILNIEKSTERAKAAEAILINAGISTDLISLYGFGQDVPMVPNDSPENQYLNRRVEIIVTY